jgi:glycerol-3-phosphate acyltransferase PlsY
VVIGYKQRMILFVSFLFGYLLGSIPFGLVLCKLAGYGDIRKIGSGNIGATNVLRTGNKFLAFLTLLLDSGKGALAIVIGVNLILTHLIPSDPAFTILTPMVIGAGAVVGHSFPVWLKFGGGKGVASALGVFLVLNPYVGLCACALWLLTALITRISSLSALVAIGLSPFAALYFSGAWLAITCVFIALIVFYRHRANIQRLLKGEEPKIGKKK